MGELDSDDDYEIHLNAKLDRESILKLSELVHPVEVVNSSGFKIAPNTVDDWSLAKIENSNWVDDVTRREDKHFEKRAYKERRQVQHEHFILFSKQCYVEFIATDPWKIIIGPPANST